MKRNKLATTVRLWGVLLLACSFLNMLSACSGDDEPTGNGVDDLAYLQQRLAADGGKVYGLRIGTDASDIVSRPVSTQADAQNEFYKLIPAGAASEGVTTNGDGSISYRLTAADGKPQGSIRYRSSPSATLYYCAEVVFSSEVRATTGISRLRYILYDRWPEEGNGFLKDILDTIKQ